MLWLWIMLAVILLIVLLCLIRVGVWVSFGGEGLRLDARVGFLRIHILPAKPQKPKTGKPKKKPKKPKKPEKTEKFKLSFTLEDVRDALRTLLPPLGRALGRTRRGIRFKPLRLSVVLGGQEDPAAMAQFYGELQAAVWTGMPILEKLVDIRDPYIHTDVDFTATGTAVEGEAGAAFRFGTLIAVGFGLAVPALKWFLRWRKRCKSRLPKPEKKGKTSPEEPEATEPKSPAA